MSPVRGEVGVGVGVGVGVACGLGLDVGEAELEAEGVGLALGVVTAEFVEDPLAQALSTVDRASAPNIQGASRRGDRVTGSP